MTKIILCCALVAPAMYSTTVAAAWDIGGGAEMYSWVEITSAAGETRKPKELGFRKAFSFNWEQDDVRDVMLGYRGKVYLGTVNYDTYIQMNGSPNDGDPVSTTTQYLGMTHEGQMTYRSSFGSYRLDYVGAAGWDWWKRTIGYSQVEDYSILFVRGGIAFDQPARGSGWHGGGGLKYPFFTREDSHLDAQGFNSNPILTPGKDISFYAEISYRISKQLDVVGYYDSWRFSKSNVVISSNSSGSFHIWQPESSMDAIGLKAMFSF
ncbi:MAG: hypothetical protein V4443_05535 [Pseudomonadota bacterium]